MFFKLKEKYPKAYGAVSLAMGIIIIIVKATNQEVYWVAYPVGIFMSIVGAMCLFDKKDSTNNKKGPSSQEIKASKEKIEKLQEGEQFISYDDMANYIIDFDKAFNNLSPSQFNDFLELYNDVLKARKTPQLISKEEYERRATEVIGILNSYAPFDKYSALTKEKTESYLEKFKKQINGCDNIVDELNLRVKISSTDPYKIYMNDKLLKLAVDFKHSKEFYGILLIQKVEENQFTLDKYIELLDYLIKNATKTEDLDEIGKEMVVYNGALVARGVISSDNATKLFEMKKTMINEAKEAL